jgi:hypothetical protein
MKYALAFGAGLAVGAWFLRAKESSCCERVKYGAIAKIAGMTGPLAPLTSGVLEATGLGALLPGALDYFGVPKDA